MILIDAGPLVAVIDRGDPDHERCIEATANLVGPLLTTWPAFTEAMYLLGRRTGWRGQRALWSLAFEDDLQFGEMTGLCERAAKLMERYKDLPMDLADASLVALAESLGLARIVTLDRHFAAYRLHGRKAFTIIP